MKTHTTPTDTPTPNGRLALDDQPMQRSVEQGTEALRYRQGQTISVSFFCAGCGHASSVKVGQPSRVACSECGLDACIVMPGGLRAVSSIAEPVIECALCKSVYSASMRDCPRCDRKVVRR